MLPYSSFVLIRPRGVDQRPQSCSPSPTGSSRLVNSRVLLRPDIRLARYRISSRILGSSIHKIVDIHRFLFKYKDQENRKKEKEKSEKE